MAQQPNHKGRKRVIFHENHQITTPTAYNSNLNTAQQELLRLHETYAHADMKEILQQIKKCDLSLHDRYLNAYHVRKTKARKDHTINIADPSQQTTNDQVLTHD
jgi:hypothetical protein